MAEGGQMKIATRKLVSNVAIQAQNDPFTALTLEKWAMTLRECQAARLDPHRACAAVMFGVPYKCVSAEQREIAKRYTFVFRFQAEYVKRVS
jgi:hypothetical protein